MVNVKGTGVLDSLVGVITAEASGTAGWLW